MTALKRGQHFLVREFTRIFANQTQFVPICVHSQKGFKATTPTSDDTEKLHFRGFLLFTIACPTYTIYILHGPKLGPFIPWEAQFGTRALYNP